MADSIPFEYKLTEAGETYSMGFMNSEQEFVKNYFPCNLKFNKAEIHIKNPRGEIHTMQLQKVRNEYVATDRFFGYTVIVSVAPLKNDKSKKSIYIRRKLINSPIPA